MNGIVTIGIVVEPLGFHNAQTTIAKYRVETLECGSTRRRCIVIGHENVKALASFQCE
jgi:hypothetical protein